jgi:hypothetical protein
VFNSEVSKSSTRTSKAAGNAGDIVEPLKRLREGILAAAWGPGCKTNLESDLDKELFVMAMEGYLSVFNWRQPKVAQLAFQKAHIALIKLEFHLQNKSDARARDLGLQVLAALIERSCAISKRSQWVKQQVEALLVDDSPEVSARAQKIWNDLAQGLCSTPFPRSIPCSEEAMAEEEGQDVIFTENTAPDREIWDERGGLFKKGAAEIAERDQDHVPEVKVLTTLGMFAVPCTAETTIGEIRGKVQEWKPEYSLEQIELVCKDKDAWGPLFNKTSRPRDDDETVESLWSDWDIPRRMMQVALWIKEKNEETGEWESTFWKMLEESKCDDWSFQGHTI